MPIPFLRRHAALPVATLLALFAATTPAPALNTYSSEQTQQFTDRCTGTKSATESTCSCTLKKLAQTVPAAALAQFLASQGSGGGFSLSQSAVTTAATVTNALVACSN